jgi:hypothetical protein
VGLKSSTTKNRIHINALYCKCVKGNKQALGYAQNECW